MRQRVAYNTGEQNITVIRFGKPLFPESKAQWHQVIEEGKATTRWHFARIALMATSDYDYRADKPTTGEFCNGANQTG